MATQAPTFGLDGSELDVMDGLFFNELTDLPVEPAHNQTLFAQPKSEPPITDEELIASLPLPHEAPAPPPAPADGASLDLRVVHLTADWGYRQLDDECRAGHWRAHPRASPASVALLPSRGMWAGLQ